MRKRKSPIALVSLLALVVVGIAGYNFATSRPNAAPAQQQAPPEVPDTKAVGEARTPTSASSIHASVTQSMSTPHGAPHAMTEDGPGRPGGPGSGGPLILGPAASSAKPEKPKPNSSSTSAQWYNSESSLAGQKG